MDIFRRSLGTYLIIAALLGVAGLIVALVKVAGLALILDGLIAATAFVGGYAARTRGSRPAWTGAAVGGVYGLLSGAQSFARHTTAAQVRQALHKAGKTPPVSIDQLVRTANSPEVHLLSLLVGVVVWGLVGLVLGALAGALAGGREAQRRQV